MTTTTVREKIVRLRPVAGRPINTARRATKLLVGGLALVIAGVALAGDTTVCLPGGDLPTVNPAIFDTASPPAREIEQMAWLVMGICAGIFVVVEGLLVYSIVKFRRKAGEQGEPV